VKNRRRNQMHHNHLRNPIIWLGLIIIPLLALLLWDEMGNLIENFQSKKKVATQEINLTAAQEPLYVDDVNSLSMHHLIEKQKDGEFRRQVYPYSVVDGGVHNVEDLRSAIWRDPVVAKHYLNFKLDRARVIEAEADRTFHVSYRIGGEIFWTRKRLKVAKGERLITDGTNFTRTRCANVLSDVPQGNTSPDEPAPEVLDTPTLSPSDPLPSTPPVVTPGRIPGSGPLPGPDPDPGAFPGPGTDPGSDPGSGPGSGPGTGPGTNPGAGPGSNPGTGPGSDPGSGPGSDPGSSPGSGPGTGPGLLPGPGPDPAPAPVPEPSTMLLLGSGLLGLLGYGRKKFFRK